MLDFLVMFHLFFFYFLSIKCSGIGIEIFSTPERLSEIDISEGISSSPQRVDCRQRCQYWGCYRVAASHVKVIRYIKVFAGLSLVKPRGPARHITKYYGFCRGA